jgi:mannose-6-phosphate isomerase-like protein (cupin superfamily)
MSQELILASPSPALEHSMNGLVAHIEDLTETNKDFRKVLYTGQHLQLVLMSLAVGQDIGDETHAAHDQFFRIEKGHGEIVIDGTTTPVKSGDAILVPAGARHNLRNTGEKSLRLYTLYGPPNHIDKLVEVTKAEAEMSSEVFDGVSTEPARH